jgi:hypothetical protein
LPVRTSRGLLVAVAGLGDPRPSILRMGGFERASFCGWWVDIGTGTLDHQNSWTSFSFQTSSSVSAPEGHLKDLFDSFRLEVRYNKVAMSAKCRVAINEEGLDGLVAHSAGSDGIWPISGPATEWEAFPSDWCPPEDSNGRGDNHPYRFAPDTG